MSSAPAAPTTPAARRDRGRTVDADLLFDAPGPRGRRRIAVISGVVTLLAAALSDRGVPGMEKSALSSQGQNAR